MQCGRPGSTCSVCIDDYHMMFPVLLPEVFEIKHFLESLSFDMDHRMQMRQMRPWWCGRGTLCMQCFSQNPKPFRLLRANGFAEGFKRFKGQNPSQKWKFSFLFLLSAAQNGSWLSSSGNKDRWTP